MSNSNDCDGNQADTNANRTKTKQLSTINKADDDGSIQEDDDSECWDDARALICNEDVADSQAEATENSDTKTLMHKQDPVPLSSDAQLRSQPSSSSAYSSLQSNDVSSLPSQTKNKSDGEHSLEVNDLVLHQAVFNNDTERIFSILNGVESVRQKELVNKRDKHGNTALHLACMLGRSKKVVSAFLQNPNRWSIDIKNLNRWTPFHEACSYGNREIISLMANQLKDDVDDAFNNGGKLSEFLEKTKNYRLVLKWEFQSWVPFVSRVLPSDVCVINKQGRFIRIDTRLLDYEGLFRKKGDGCLVYSNKKWIFMNNKTKKYQYFEAPSVYKNIEGRIDEFMSTDIVDFELKSSDMQFTRSTSGWIWKADKTDKVGRYNAALYDFANVFLVTRKRREHLSEEDLKRNKNAYKSAVHMFKFGEKPGPRDLQNYSGQDGADGESAEEMSGGDDEEEVEQEEIHRESLAPPPETTIAWEQYINAEPPGCYPTLGREIKCKINKLAVKASVAMSEDFPITKNEFLELLSIVPLKMFKKLKEFVEMKLPDGFPVRLDIPIFPFLSARITFEDFNFIEGPVDESLFSVPHDYERDFNLLPGRWNNNSDSS